MPLDHHILDRTAGPTRVSWTTRDAQLYALGVGYGQDDPLSQLDYTAGDNPRVLPTFAVNLLQFHGPHVDFGDIAPSARLHAEQSSIVWSPLPSNGSLDVRRRVTGIYDKGTAALVTIESTATDPATGLEVARSVSTSFVRGEGGFGGASHRSAPSPIPDRPPDRTAVASTRSDQALLYRLSGDYNSLHYDPEVAARAGFARPILQGLCTYGIACRVLVEEMCGGNSDRFAGISGRFSKAVLPGCSLTLEIWHTGINRAAFRVLDQRGDAVFDRGQFDFDRKA